MAFKSRKRTSEAGGDFVQSRDEKRARTESTKNNSGSNFHQPDLDVNCKIDANGDHYWEISKMRRVTISTFRGKTMVNIREYYEKDGQELPGKKGISMPMDQYAAFVTLLPDIEAILKENGQSVPRPNYADAKGLSDEGGDEDQGEFDNNVEDTASASPKKNIEATSDEDEDEEEEVITKA